MMGLDLTNQALADMSVIERMEKLGNKAGKLFGDMMRFTFFWDFVEENLKTLN